MKLLFVSKFLDKHTIYRVPLGILCLSAALKKAEHRVLVCEPTREDPLAMIKQSQPDMVAYSVRTGFHRYYLDLNKKLKQQCDFFAVFGGPHATFFPEMIHEEGVDAVALGECDEAIVELLGTMQQSKDYHATRNFWFKTDGKIICNELRPLEQHLDNLPFPDRSLLDDYKEVQLARVHNFITARGCPFHCSYCFNHKLREMYHGQKYVRRRSVDNVIKEIAEVSSRYNLERVHFEDDTFNMSKEWLREFVAKYQKIPFKCNVRANLVDEEVVQLLKEANCISVTFAIEAGNDRIRNEILHRNMSADQIINCAKLLKKYKIKFITENILANPTSTLADDIETLDLNLLCQTDYPTVSLLQPYPKTKVFDIAVENNQFDHETIHKIQSFYVASPLRISDKEERINLQKLFALVVAFPFLRKHLDFLIRQKKLTKLYSFLYSMWRPYCLIFKILPHRLSLKELIWLVKRYLTD